MKTSTLLKSEAEWAAICWLTKDYGEVERIRHRVDAIIAAIEAAGGHYKHARRVYDFHRIRKETEIRAAAQSLGE